MNRSLKLKGEPPIVALGLNRWGSVGTARKGCLRAGVLYDVTGSRSLEVRQPHLEVCSQYHVGPLPFAAITDDPPPAIPATGH